MNPHFAPLAVVGALLVSLGIYAIVSPVGGAYHTYYEDIFRTRFPMQSHDEKIVDLLLENQTRYRFTLSAASPLDVKTNVIITDSEGDRLSILDFRDLGGTILGEFISNESGNYSIYLKELNEGFSYTTDFSVAERFDDYYPDGGRYASINRSIQSAIGVLLVVFGICFFLVELRKKQESVKGKRLNARASAIYV